MEPPLPDPRYAPPRTQVEDTGPSVAGRLASRGKRLAAAMVDGVLVLAAILSLTSVMDLDLFSPQAQASWGTRLLGAVVGVLVFAAIQAYPLLRRGQTVGKMLLKMRIARPDGSPVDPGRLALRYGIAIPFSVVPLVAQVYALVDCLAIFRRSRRCLHDSVADTVVLDC